MCVLTLTLSACGENSDTVVNNRRGSLPDFGSTNNTTPVDMGMDMPATNNTTPVDMGQDMPPSGMTAQEFAEGVVTEYVRLVCENAWTCGEKDPLSLIAGGRFASKQECIDNYESVTPEARGLLLAAQGTMAGRTVFDEAKAGMCLTDLAAAVNAASCMNRADAVRLPASCDGVLTGRAADGGRCVFDVDCADIGASCVTNGADSCSGTCLVPQVLCGGVTCAAGEYCKPGPGEMQTCTPFATEGGECEFPGDACPPGLLCYFTSFEEDTGTCIQEFTIPDGQFCEFDDMCVSGLCRNDTGQCGSPPVPSLSAMGGACTPPSAPTMNPRLCNPGLVCADIDPMTITGTCKEPAGAGGSCRSLFDCALGFACGSRMPDGTGTCNALVADGGACMENDECVSGFCQFDEVAGTGACSSIAACSGM